MDTGVHADHIYKVGVLFHFALLAPAFMQLPIVTPHSPIGILDYHMQASSEVTMEMVH